MQFFGLKVQHSVQITQQYYEREFENFTHVTWVSLDNPKDVA